MKIIIEDIKNLDKYDKILKQYQIKEEKLQRIKKKIPQERKLSLLGELIFIKALKDYFNIDYQEINIVYNENGKPYIENSNLYFNISHTNNKVVVVLDKGEIGIDIMGNNRKTKNIINYLSCDEKELIEKKKIKIVEIFALKEAQIKCNGLSIMDFKNVNIFTKYRYILMTTKEFTIAICKKR